MGIYIPGWNGQKPGMCHAKDKNEDDCPFLKRQGTAGHFYCGITGGFVDAKDNKTEKPCSLEEVSDIDMSLKRRDISLSDILYFSESAEVSVMVIVEAVQRAYWDDPDIPEEKVPREIIYAGTGSQLRNRLPIRLIFSRVFALRGPTKNGEYIRVIVEDVKDSVLER